MLLWALVDLRPDGAPAHGYSGPGRIPLRTLTSGIRAEGRQNLGNISGSHGDGGTRERLWWVTRMVVTGELDSGPG
jgi:hypothetical protein